MVKAVCVQKTRINRFHYFESNTLVVVLFGSCSFNAYSVFDNWREEESIPVIWYSVIWRGLAVKKVIKMNIGGAGKFS